MTLDLPTDANEVVQRSKTDVQRELPNSNPFLKNSAISAIVTACARRVYDFYYQLAIATREMIWSTSTGQTLEDWASVYGITRNPATPAFGMVVATGTEGSTIPIGTNLRSSDGLVYSSTAESIVSTSNVSVASITRLGNVATAVFDFDHGLANDVPVTVAGAAQPEYNGIFTVTVTSAREITYEVSGSPLSPATGIIVAAWTTAPINIESDGLGSENNQSAGVVLTFSSPIAGVNADVVVDFDTLGSGTDLESDEALKARFLDRVQNPVANFNVSSIEAQAKTISGVTRVFVEEITPSVGQTTVYFTRDDDASVIPSGPEVNEVRDALLEIKPAHMDPVDFIIAAPVGIPVDFAFVSYAPASPSMETAIRNNINQFFREQNVVSQDVDQDEYRAAIINTIDPDTGIKVTDFELSAPIGDIPISSGELATLGTIIFP